MRHNRLTIKKQVFDNEDSNNYKKKFKRKE